MRDALSITAEPLRSGTAGVDEQQVRQMLGNVLSILLIWAGVCWMPSLRATRRR